MSKTIKIFGFAALAAGALFAQTATAQVKAVVSGAKGIDVCSQQIKQKAARPIERAKTVTTEFTRFVAAGSACPRGFVKVATFATAESVQNITQNYITENSAALIGPTGAQGAKGDMGAVGPQGQQGANGLPGPVGPQGPQGDVGFTGAQGAQGPVGPQGEAGPVGAVGAVGPQGLQGEAGQKGDLGLTGPQGPQGPAGAQGSQGVQGVQGSSGFGVLGGFNQRWNQASSVFRDVVNVWGVGSGTGSGSCAQGNAQVISSHYQYNPVDGMGYGYTFLCVQTQAP